MSEESSIYAKALGILHDPLRPLSEAEMRSWEQFREDRLQELEDGMLEGWPAFRQTCFGPGVVG